MVFLVPFALAALAAAHTSTAFLPNFPPHTSSEQSGHFHSQDESQEGVSHHGTPSQSLYSTTSQQPREAGTQGWFNSQLYPQQPPSYQQQLDNGWSMPHSMSMPAAQSEYTPLLPHHLLPAYANEQMAYSTAGHTSPQDAAASSSSNPSFSTWQGVHPYVVAQIGESRGSRGGTDETVETRGSVRRARPGVRQVGDNQGDDTAPPPPPRPRWQREAVTDAMREIIDQEWTKRGLGRHTHPQEMAAQTAEIKLDHPEEVRSLGQLIKLRIQSWRDRDYLYDYQAWSDAYTIKVATVRSSLAMRAAQEAWPSERMKNEILVRFRDIRINHHGTLSDPVQEAREMAIAERVWLHLLSTRAGTLPNFRLTLAQATNMPFMATFLANFRYSDFSHVDTIKYVKKYLRQKLQVTVPQIELLSSLMPGSQGSTATRATRTRRRAHQAPPG